MEATKNFIRSTGFSASAALTVKIGNIQPNIKQTLTSECAVFQSRFGNHGFYWERDLGQVEIPTDDFLTDQYNHFLPNGSDL